MGGGGNFVERTLGGLTLKMERALEAEELARADGLLQRLDPRVKVLGLLSLVLAVALARNFKAILCVFVVALALAYASRVPLRTLAVRVWLSALLFTGLIALPAIFITPGEVAYQVPLLAWPVTWQGLKAAGLLLTRVETTVTLSLLLVLCTPWSRVLKALSVLGVPSVFIVILGMTYRYIFLLLQVAREMFEARRSRLLGTLDAPQRRRLAAASAGVLLGKTFQVSNEVYLAMQSRGFRGEVHTLDELRLQTRDWAWLAALIAAAVVAVWLGR